MILLDTNVLIYASAARSPFFEWARRGPYRDPHHPAPFEDRGREVGLAGGVRPPNQDC